LSSHRPTAGHSIKTSGSLNFHKPDPDKPEKIATKAQRHKEKMIIYIKLSALLRHSLFDIRYSFFQSFIVDLTGRFLAGGWAET